MTNDVLRIRAGAFLWIVCILSAFAPVTAHAQDEEVEPSRRLWLYFGANAGYTKVEPSSSVRESSRSGYAFGPKVLLSYYFANWVNDLGLGYQRHYASGDDTHSALLNPTVSVRTNAGFVEYSPRYRFGPHWQLGPVVNAYFGTDVSYSESTSRETSNVTLVGGGRVDWETAGELEHANHRWRFGAQILHDLSLQNRGVWWAMADVQFGIPISPDANSRVEESPREPPAATPTPPARPVAPKFAELTAEKSVKVYLGEAVLRFKTASAELRPSSTGILAKVAKYLNASPDAWKSMRVDGHADIRGKLSYNMRLSAMRASRVKKSLIALGVPAVKLKSEGFGPNRPIDPAMDLEAYALNRRVELWLDGVTDPEALVRDLNELH
ncbi:MAG: OmpA family protein [Cryobacterium sp.]|nr:OmpA family protein [Oligoflexia bacterium]